jgi:hypothetical protein
MRAALRAFVGCWLLAGIANAQNSAPQGLASDDRETIQQLVQQVKQLQEKVAALESKQAATPVAVSAPETAAATPDAPDNSAAQIANFQDSHDVHGIRWHGFGEVNYKVLNQRQPELGNLGFVPGSAGNFYTGDFDLFLTSKLTEKASVLAEIVIGEGDAQSFDLELARALLKYDYNDHLRLSAGRYHTGVSYYNTTYHSGRFLQTTVDRPLAVEFAGDAGLLPTQAVGVSVTGEIPSGKLGLNYSAEYGSSDTIRPDLDGVGSIDENNGNHINFGLFVRPESFPGLQIGGSYYHDRISDFLKGPSVRLGQTIINAHAVYIAHNLEILNEAFLIRDAYEQGGPAYNMPAFYTQFSRRFGKVRPFFRYQYANLNGNSVYHDDVLLRYGPSFGARYDLNDSIAFKAQLDHTVRKGKPDLNGLQMQLAFSY